MDDVKVAPRLAGHCGTCPFWLGRANETGADSWRSKGACRRLPPVAAVGASTLWPVTGELDWCGEHPDLVHLKINLPPVAPDVVRRAAKMAGLSPRKRAKG